MIDPLITLIMVCQPRSIGGEFAQLMRVLEGYNAKTDEAKGGEETSLHGGRRKLRPRIIFRLPPPLRQVLRQKHRLMLYVL